MTMTKAYVSRGATFGRDVVRIVETGTERINGVDMPTEQVYPLPFHKRHSPTGWAWGYGGSGPAQLALDILWDYLGEEPPAWLYQQFKDEVVGRVPRDEQLRITGPQIEEWLDVQANPGLDPWGKGQAFLDARRTPGHDPTVTVPADGTWGQITAEQEHRIRQQLWQSHGHEGIYGDDGEMQCNYAGDPVDYLRDPLDRLLEHGDRARLEAAARR